MSKAVLRTSVKWKKELFGSKCSILELLQSLNKRWYNIDTTFICTKPKTNLQLTLGFRLVLPKTFE